jgi:hypothetical protein
MLLHYYYYYYYYYYYCYSLAKNYFIKVQNAANSTCTAEDFVSASQWK